MFYREDLPKVKQKCLIDFLTLQVGKFAVIQNTSIRKGEL